MTNHDHGDRRSRRAFLGRAASLAIGARILGAQSAAARSLSMLCGELDGAQVPSLVPSNINVIEILLDDGGAEFFNWSGLQEPLNGYALTPRLDQLRARGVTFTRAYASPICGPTRAMNETGIHAFREGQGWGGNIESDDVFAFGLDGDGQPTVTSLARALRLGRDATDDLSIGLHNFTYANAWFGKSHMCSDTGFEQYQIQQKYGRYKGCQPNVSAVVDDGVHEPDDHGGHFHFTEVDHTFGIEPKHATYGSELAWDQGQENLDFVAWQPGTSQRGWDAYVNIRDAIGWANVQTQPFFMKICMNPPHAPFEAPPFSAPDTVGFGATQKTITLVSQATQDAVTQLDGGDKGPGYRPTSSDSRRVVYKANLEAVDALVGLLYDRISPSKRSKTVFIFVGDNGTVGDVVDQPYQASHAKRTLYELGARVPMIVWSGGNHIVKPGRTCDHLVHVVDLFSTILELCACDPTLWNPQAQIPIDGLSILPLLLDPSAPPVRRFIYNEIFQPLEA